MTDNLKTILKLVLEGLFLLALVFGAYRLYSVSEQLTQAKASLALSEANVAALRADAKATADAARVHAAQTATNAAASAAQQKELDNALQASGSWAGTPVPDAVWNGLFHAGAGSTETPASK